MNWLTLSIVINVILAMIVVAAIRWNLEHMSQSLKEELRLKDLLILRERMLIAEKMRSIITPSPTAKPSLDTKTMSLLVLAVSNTNENEARSAAMQVCKRIKKSL